MPSHAAAHTALFAWLDFGAEGCKESAWTGRARTPGLNPCRDGSRSWTLGDPIGQAEPRIRRLDHGAQILPRPRNAGLDGPHRQIHPPGDFLVFEAVEPV